MVNGWPPTERYNDCPGIVKAIHYLLIWWSWICIHMMPSLVLIGSNPIVPCSVTGNTKHWNFGSRANLSSWTESQNPLYNFSPYQPLRYLTPPRAMTYGLLFFLTMYQQPSYPHLLTLPNNLTSLTFFQPIVICSLIPKPYHPKEHMIIPSHFCLDLLLSILNLTTIHHYTKLR